MNSSLKNRVEKLERETVISDPPRTIDPEYKEYLDFLYGREFLAEIFNNARTMLLTMPDDDARRLFDDCLRVEQFQNRDRNEQDDYKHHPFPAPVTEYFFSLLKLSLEGMYIGPLAIPQVIADCLRGQRSVSVGMADCEDCAYVMPSHEKLGYRTAISYEEQFQIGSRYINMRCVLCGGKVGEDAYHKKHPDRIPLWNDQIARNEIRKAKLPFSYHHTHIGTWDLMIIVLHMFGPKDEP